MTPKRIKQLRSKLRLTQAEFAAKVYANRVTVARWETGVSKPRGLYLRVLENLAERAKRKK